MSSRSQKPQPRPQSRQDLILEAILTVGEIRKPGYVQKVLDQLSAPNETVVTELWASEDETAMRAEAIEWLQSAAIRVRARAAERQVAKRLKKK